MSANQSSFPFVQYPSDTTQSGKVGLEVLSKPINLDCSEFNINNVTINNTHIRSGSIFINKTEYIYFTKDSQPINNGTRVLIKANIAFNISCQDHNDRDNTRSATSVRQKAVSSERVRKTTSTKYTTTTTAPLMKNDDDNSPKTTFTSKVDYTKPRVSIGADTLATIKISSEAAEFTNTNVGSTDNLPTEMKTFSKASDAVKLSTTTVHLQDKPTEKLENTNEPTMPSWLIYIIGPIVGGMVIVGTVVILIFMRKKKQRVVKQRDCDNGVAHEVEKDSTYHEISHEAFGQPEGVYHYSTANECLYAGGQENVKFASVDIEHVCDTTNNGDIHIYDHAINTISGRAITDNVYNCLPIPECDNYNAYDISQ